MGLLTVVEAASLSGLPPEVIRDLIGRGRLPARSVVLPSGLGYLIEPADLELFTSDGLSTLNQSPGLPAAARQACLEAALAGMQAALARRRSAADTTTPRAEPDDQPRPVSSLPLGRTTLGLSQDDIGALVARVDGLLTPGDEGKPENQRP